MTSPKIRASLLRGLIIVIGVALLYLALKNVHLAELWEALRTARFGYVGLAVLATVATYVLRTWRWMALLVPVGRTRFTPAFRATVMGFMAIFLLARVGEVLRPYWLAKREGLPFPPTLATVVLERVLDIVAVLLLFVVFVVTTDVAALGPRFEPVKLGGEIAAVAALLALVILFVCAGHPDRLSRLVAVPARLLPARAAEAVGKFVHTFAQGFAVMRQPGPLVAAAALSLPLWGSIAATIWFTSVAFDLTIPFAGAFLVLMFLVVGVAIPIPGNVGTFEWFYITAVTQFFAAPEAGASAAALVLHAVSFVPVCIGGLIFMAQDGLTLGGLRKLGEEASVNTAAGQ